MASNQHTGLNPLNIPRVDASQSGINSAFAEVSREVARRTPRESMESGSLQIGSGKFSVPATPSEQVRPRHAFHAVVYMDALDSSIVKANFQAAYVIEQDDTQFPVFATEAAQTVAIADGDKYWVAIVVDDSYNVQSASFVEDPAPVDVAPTPSSNGTIYKLCVEFDVDADDKFVVTYHRFDSINYRPASTSTLPYTIYFADDTILTLSEATILAAYVAGGDSWNIEFAVTGSAMAGTVVYGAGIPRYDSTTSQTLYRLPVIRDGVRVSSGGLYEEDTKCVNGNAVVQLYKIG